MKSLRLYFAALLAIALITSCSEDDDLPPDPQDFEVEVSFTGDVDEFIWNLDLFGRREGAGVNLFDIFDPSDQYYDRAFASNGDLDAGTPYLFLAGFADEIKVDFTTTSFDTDNEGETYTMTINVKIRKAESGTTNFRQISSFSRTFERLPSGTIRDLNFSIEATKFDDQVTCQGNHCP